MLLKTCVLIQLWDFGLHKHNWIFFKFLANVYVKAVICLCLYKFPKVLGDMFFLKE